MSRACLAKTAKLPEYPFGYYITIKCVLEKTKFRFIIKERKPAANRLHSPKKAKR
jgi:hypothetical protein